MDHYCPDMHRSMRFDYASEIGNIGKIVPSYGEMLDGLDFIRGRAGTYVAKMTNAVLSQSDSVTHEIDDLVKELAGVEISPLLCLAMQDQNNNADVTLDTAIVEGLEGEGGDDMSERAEVNETQEPLEVMNEIDADAEDPPQEENEAPDGDEEALAGEFDEEEAASDEVDSTLECVVIERQKELIIIE